MTARSLATITAFAVTMISATTRADAPSVSPEARERFRLFTSCGHSSDASTMRGAEQLAQCLRLLDASDHLSLAVAESFVAQTFATLGAERGAPLLALQHGIACVRNADRAPRTPARARARSRCAAIIRTSIQLVPWIPVEGPCVAEIIVGGDQQLITPSPSNPWTPTTPGPVTLQLRCPNADVNSTRVTLVAGRRYTIATTIQRVE